MNVLLACLFPNPKIMQNIDITYVPIWELEPAQHNPRYWSKCAIKDLTESIKQFGLVDPILVNGSDNRKNIVIGGHFRLKVAKDLGFKEVPVLYLDIPDEAKEKELNLRLNKNQGEWDFELLRDFEVDILKGVGFDSQEIEDIWSDALGAEDDDFNVEEELQKIKEPFVKEGELYQLGKHRLLCGDATKIEDVKRLVGESAIPMIYSDPPFNINLNYNKGIGTKGKYGGSKVQDNKSDSNYRQFLKETLKNALTVTSKDTHVFYWCDERYIGLLQDLYRELGIENKRVCLWIKNNQMVTPEIAFNKVYEPCVYGVRGKPVLSKKYLNLNEVLNKEVGTGNQLHEDIQDLFNIWLVRRLPANQYEHPTQKPPTLHEKAIKRCTQVGDVVLDLFGGSGSTMIACEQLKRACYMTEIDPVFCSLIITRYEKLTGQKAQLTTQTV